MIDWFYSDPHFGHANIIKLQGRPFRDMMEMEVELIERYNDFVGAYETVCWLGDCSFYSAEKTSAILYRMNGNKILVRGNHDGKAAKMAQLGFDLVVDEAVMQIAGRKVRLSHYPYAEGEPPYGSEEGRYLDRRPQRRHREVLIHGHTHSHKQLHGNMIHVGVDAWDFHPVNIRQIAELLKAIPEGKHG